MRAVLRRTNRNYLFFIVPAFIFFTIFVALPILYVFLLAFTDWSGMGEIHFTGLQNIITIFTDYSFAPIFKNALFNNLKYLLCVWFIITPFQYMIAYLLYIKIPGWKYIKFMIYFPCVISPVITGFFAKLLFDPNIGFLNEVLSGLGRPTAAWFGDPNMAFKLLIVLVIWNSAGTGILIFYSNFVSMPLEVMEACRVDGCREWQRFFYVLLPMSLPSAASNITMSTIWALAVFDLPFLLGGTDGGVKGKLDFANTVFYRYTFGSGLNARTNLGFGAAISLVVFVIMLLVTVIQSRILSRFEYE